MIDKAFLQKIGLDDVQTVLLMDGLKKESRFRQILLQENISPGVVEPIVRSTTLDEIDLENEDLLREKIRVEFGSFISKR